MGARRRGSRLRPRDSRRRALLPRANECTDVRGHISGATKRKEKDKEEDQKAILSKLDGYFFRPTPPPEPEVVATASGVSSPSPSPPTTLAGVSQMYSDNRDDKAAASCSSREPGLTLDQPHPSPSGSLPASDRAKKLDIQRIVDEFAERKARRVPFE
ncbi:hypothetical protein KUCAC02_014372 [Chaenocephalus aceratus]|uniref:Uncharacterized protein n=1 Tax=Chaenocephalus aceratus TaxID=36190 RepID=A0ACB9WEK9_CHAAC|nr:hypothetical protein KUCAC02_014372 [Chaenocephalus aceratus]